MYLHRTSHDEEIKIDIVPIIIHGYYLLIYDHILLTCSIVIVKSRLSYTDLFPRFNVNKS